MKELRIVLQIMLVMVVLAAGAGGAYWLLKNPRKAKRAEVEAKPMLVRTIPATPSRQRLEVTAMGTVVPAMEIELQPQVAGRIIEQSAELLPGGRFETGDVIARIDPRDYELAVEQQQALVQRARFELKVEQGRGAIAEREWGLLETDVPTTEDGRSLALRKPHLQNAKAALAAAESALKKTKLDLERTTLRAPFNALVLKEAVDVGQLVSPQTRLATLVGTDSFYVQVSVPVDRLGSIRIPTTNGRPGARSKVIHSLSNGTCNECEGRVVRLLGDISPAGRMARLLVEIEDPLGAGKAPLLLGAYVRVEIEGGRLDGVYELPRRTIREGGRVWVVNADDQLEVRQVKIAHGRTDTVIVSEGIAEGDNIITSPIATPMPGMRLRVEQIEDDEEKRTPAND
ncbi:MAG: efflux RND transporter periplasmic adaptor subunit [Planctomycetes bacterium]|nr:efflux RND transporter periplasmic adaptor subunit [Planctomycetota bacterium]